MKNNPTRVLQVVRWMNQGGVENLLMNIYRNIDRSKVQFDFVVHSEQGGFFDGEIEALGGRIFHCPEYRIYNHSEYSKWWNSFLNEHSEYKIIHSHLDSCANIHLRIAKKHGLKTIAHSHNTSEGEGVRAFVKKLLKTGFNSCCDCKFACSKAAAKWLYGKDADKAVIISNAIEPERFVYDSQIAAKVKNELLINEDTFVVGHVGRFNAQKNHSFLVEIFAEICRLERNSILLLVGSGDLENDIRKKVKALGIENNVMFLGVRSDVNEILQAMDVFLFPSLYEGLPVTLIEAQAAGLPCVISSTITDEVCITDLTEQISLECSAEEWAKAVLNQKSRERKNTEEIIRREGYDIKNTADEFVRFYIEQEG